MINVKHVPAFENSNGTFYRYSQDEAYTVDTTEHQKVSTAKVIYREVMDHGCRIPYIGVIIFSCSNPVLYTSGIQ